MDKNSFVCVFVGCHYVVRLVSPVSEDSIWQKVLSNARRKNKTVKFERVTTKAIVKVETKEIGEIQIIKCDMFG